MSLPSCFRERQNYRGRDRDRANECEREIETEMDSESERVLMTCKKKWPERVKEVSVSVSCIWVTSMC